MRLGKLTTPTSLERQVDLTRRARQDFLTGSGFFVAMHRSRCRQGGWDPLPTREPIEKY